MLGLLSQDCGSDDESDDHTNSGAAIGLSDESEHNSITQNVLRAWQLILEDTTNIVLNSVPRISDSVEEPTDVKLSQCSQSEIKYVKSSVITLSEKITERSV